MSKKEFYETYIKDNRTEDEKMMDIIHENARKNKNDKFIVKRINQRKKGVSMPMVGILIIIGMIVGYVLCKLV